VRVANWRFLATTDAGGPATFATNVRAAEAALKALADQDVLGAFARPVAAVRQALDAARSLSAQSMTVKGQVDRFLAAIRVA
jgi:hypothetical protein